MMLVYYPNSPEGMWSAEVRTIANDWLIDEGFIATGKFSGGYADWFVIGGRWSGKLTSIQNESTGESTRDPYKEYGYEDDAQLLTPELYKAIRENGLENGEAAVVGYNQEVFDDELCEAMIGKYWVVVVDYHN